MTKCETAICQLAVNVYGKTSQCTVCMEEMAELQRLDNRISQSLIHPKP